MPQRPPGPGPWRPAALLALGLLLATLAFGYAGWSARPDAAAEPQTPEPRPVAAAPAPATPPVADDLRAELERLRAALGHEREARARLTEQLETLQARVEDLSKTRAGSPTPAGAPATAQRARGMRRWIDRSLLRSAGFGAAEAERLADAYDSIEMDRLELENRATREGWRRTGRFAQAQVQLEQRVRGLREQFDEDEYDWLLFASGRPNRVVVRNVLGVSPAAQAGLQPGDLIVSYAGERVYSNQQLVGATTEGHAGDLVRVEIERNGEPRTVFLPRGPLGVQIGPRVVRPAPTG